jgi:hypothetical protein
MKSYLHYYRPAIRRDVAKTFKVVSGATVESLNKFAPGSAIDQSGQLFFKGNDGQAAELRLRHKVTLKEV